MWHAQATRLTVRFIRPPGTPAAHSEPDAMAQVDLRTDGLAFIHAAKTHPPITRRDWFELARMLVREYGATRVEGDIGGGLFVIDADRVLRSSQIL